MQKVVGSNPISRFNSTARECRAVSEENVEIVRAAFEAIARRDSEALDALAREHMARGFEFEAVLTGQTYHGIEGIRGLAADLWETVDYTPQIEELIASGEQVVSVLRISGRGARSGASVSQGIAIVWTFDGGRLVRGQSFTSRAEALEVAGLAE
jgi:ketosteroid isomerase-like protein